MEALPRLSANRAAENPRFRPCSRAKKGAGSVTVGGRELSDICEKVCFKNFTYVNNKSYLFKGTVRENLLMANPDCSDEVLWQVLERVNLAAF